MKAAFVGHFAPLGNALDAASSAAGNQVQRQVVRELVRQSGIDQTICYSMAPHPAWPGGPLFVSSSSEESIAFIGYLNLPILKHMVFAVRLFGQLLMHRPKLCIQYNAYLFENLVLLLFRMLDRTRKLVGIIQDVHVRGEAILFSKASLKALAENISVRMIGAFDMIIPISRAIVDDFNLPIKKCHVFQGGLTEFSAQLMNESGDCAMEDIGVFAGSLEPHNGVDRLVARWIASDIDVPLHIFGRGSLSKQIESEAVKTKNIIFHGFQSEQVILGWQKKARWNFCFRYSIGLNQTYFFPSKLFNILCSPGAVVVNAFHAFPEALQEYVCVAKDDLSNLSECLAAGAVQTEPARIQSRREFVNARYSWKFCVANMIDHTLFPLGEK